MSKFSKKLEMSCEKYERKRCEEIYLFTKHKGLPTKVKSENKLFENPVHPDWCERTMDKIKKKNFHLVVVRK